MWGGILEGWVGASQSFPLLRAELQPAIKPGGVGWWVWGNTLNSADLQLGHGLSLAKDEEMKGGEGGHRISRRGMLKICHQ